MARNALTGGVATYVDLIDSQHDGFYRERF